MAVDEHDPAEARLDKRVDEVLDQCQVRRGADVAEARESAVPGREPVRNRRSDERVAGECHAPAHLARDDHVGSDRAVRAMLLRRSCGNEQEPRPARHELGHLGLGELVKKYGLAIHRHLLILRSGSRAAETAAPG